MSENKVEVFVGIDVSKSTLEVRIEPPGEAFHHHCARILTSDDRTWGHGSIDHPRTRETG